MKCIPQIIRTLVILASTTGAVIIHWLHLYGGFFFVCAFFVYALPYNVGHRISVNFFIVFFHSSTLRLYRP